MKQDNGSAVLSIEEVSEITVAALARAGADEVNAEAVARTVTVAERDGAASHGLFRVPGYVAALKSGKVNGAARPVVKEIAPSVIRADGDRGFAPLTHEAVAAPLADLAKRQGVAVAAVLNVAHFSALWRETGLVAEHGCVALACVSYMPMVAPAGGKAKLFGSDPVSFAWPRPDGEPMIFDQATAARAMGEVQIAAREGKALPPGVGIDADGNDTTDPNDIQKGGALLPFGGYKGSAIALMVELLAGPLIGECLGFEAAEEDNRDGGPPLGGEFILAIDPLRTRTETGRSSFAGSGGSAGEHAERLFGRMLEMEGVRLPGDGRKGRRERVAREGVKIPLALYEKIVG
ncbi:MAG: Ldh family oxidoreductase [Alphaproteobacteria bacterium]|nr:Ldh family oxidoreductase [Alphaproteobacteria bacterium]